MRVIKRNEGERGLIMKNEKKSGVNIIVIKQSKCSAQKNQRIKYHAYPTIHHSENISKQSKILKLKIGYMYREILHSTGSRVKVKYHYTPITKGGTRRGSGAELN